MKEKKNNLSAYINVFSIIITVLSFFSALFVFVFNKSSAYTLMPLLPITFIICYHLFLKKSMYYFLEFGISFTLVCSVRYVLLPFLIVAGGRYDGRSAVFPMISSFNFGFFLMIYELIITSLVIAFLSIKLKKMSKNLNFSYEMVFPKKKWFYIIFIAMVLLAIIIRPNTIMSFSFLFPNTSLGNYDSFEIFDQIIILCTLAAKNFIFILLISKFYHSYEKNHSFIYVLMSLVLVLLNSIIYFGTNRFDFILNIVASTIIFCLLYKKFAKRVILAMCALSIFMFVLMTQSRGIKIISNNNNELYGVADNFQMYFGGPYNVAIAVETAEYYPEGRNFGTLLYDFNRSVLGLNVIVKKIDGYKLTSDYFNYRIFYGSHSSQIMPMIGEGYYLLGLILSPLIDVFFILIAYYMKKKSIHLNRIEVLFFFLITFIRLGFMMGQTATIQMNDLSFNLFLPMIIIFINNKFNIRNDRRIDNYAK